MKSATTSQTQHLKTNEDLFQDYSIKKESLNEILEPCECLKEEPALLSVETNVKRNVGFGITTHKDVVIDLTEDVDEKYDGKGNNKTFNSVEVYNKNNEPSKLKLGAYDKYEGNNNIHAINKTKSSQKKNYYNDLNTYYVFNIETNNFELYSNNKIVIINIDEGNDENYNNQGDDCNGKKKKEGFEADVPDIVILEDKRDIKRNKINENSRKDDPIVIIIDDDDENEEHDVYVVEDEADDQMSIVSIAVVMDNDTENIKGSLQNLKTDETTQIGAICTSSVKSFDLKQPHYKQDILSELKSVDTKSFINVDRVSSFSSDNKENLLKKEDLDLKINTSLNKEDHFEGESSIKESSSEVLLHIKDDPVIKIADLGLFESSSEDMSSEENEPPPPFLCTYCTTCFKCKDRREIHTKWHECDCGINQRNSPRVGKNVRICHPKGSPQLNVGTRYKEITCCNFKAQAEGNFTCSICKKSFQQKASLKAHQQIHSENITFFECEVCQMKFVLKRDMQLHLERQHAHGGTPTQSNSQVRVMQEDKRTFTCNICQKKFECDASLKLHVRIHKQEKRVLHPKQFVQRKYDRRSAVSNKRNVKFFKCHLCWKSFSRYVILQEHIKTHYFGRSFKCYLCRHQFYQYVTLREHVRSYHLYKKPFKCYTCRLTFFFMYQLRAHIRAHARRWYFCQY